MMMCPCKCELFYLQSGATLFNAELTLCRPLDLPEDWSAKDYDHTAWLCKETIEAGHSVLIFCGTKRVTS